MKKTLRAFSIFLLLFLSFGAFYGGLSLIIDPSGTKLGLPPETISLTPFENFLIPGIILFVVNGLLSLAIAVSVFLKVKRYEWFMICQGCLLAGWLTVEILMGIFDPFMQYTCYGISILLIISGSLLLRNSE